MKRTVALDAGPLDAKHGVYVLRHGLVLQLRLLRPQSSNSLLMLFARFLQDSFYSPGHKWSTKAYLFFWKLVDERGSSEVIEQRIRSMLSQNRLSLVLKSFPGDLKTTAVTPSGSDIKRHRKKECSMNSCFQGPPTKQRSIIRFTLKRCKFDVRIDIYNSLHQTLFKYKQKERTNNK